MTRQERDQLVERCRAALEVLPPDCAISHLTAAAIHGIPMSYAMEEERRVHVIRPITSAQTRVAGFVGHRVLHPRDVVPLHGLTVVGVADTWADLGELVGRGKPVGLDDLVVAGDACATKLGTPTPLARAVARRVRPRGKRTLVEALGLVRVGSASAGETLARVMLLRAGLPEPGLNVPVHASAGPRVLLGVGDLVWRVRTPGGGLVTVIGEYQGADFHSSEAQRAHDALRRQGLEREGCVVEEIWRDDMVSTEARTATVARFAAALYVPLDTLDLGATAPHFFSQHAMELALQRESLHKRGA